MRDVDRDCLGCGTVTGGEDEQKLGLSNLMRSELVDLLSPRIPLSSTTSLTFPFSSLSLSPIESRRVSPKLPSLSPSDAAGPVDSFRRVRISSSSELCVRSIGSTALAFPLVVGFRGGRGYPTDFFDGEGERRSIGTAEIARRVTLGEDGAMAAICVAGFRIGVDDGVEARLYFDALRLDRFCVGRVLYSKYGCIDDEAVLSILLPLSTSRARGSREGVTRD
jgi:hypothetical protein